MNVNSIFIFVSRHVTLSGIYYYLPLLLILYFLSPQQTPQQVWLFPWRKDQYLHPKGSGPFVICSDWVVVVSHCCSEVLVTPRCPKGSPVF